MHVARPTRHQRGAIPLVLVDRPELSSPHPKRLQSTEAVPDSIQTVVRTSGPCLPKTQSFVGSHQWKSSAVADVIHQPETARLASVSLFRSFRRDIPKSWQTKLYVSHSSRKSDSSRIPDDLDTCHSSRNIKSSDLDRTVQHKPSLNYLTVIPGIFDRHLRNVRLRRLALCVELDEVVVHPSKRLAMNVDHVP